MSSDHRRLILIGGRHGEPPDLFADLDQMRGATGPRQSAGVVVLRERTVEVGDAALNRAREEVRTQSQGVLDPAASRTR